MDGTMAIYPMVATRSEVHQGVFDDVSRGFHRQASHRLGVMRSREIPLLFHPIPLYPKAVSREEIARNPIRAELQYASRRQEPALGWFSNGRFWHSNYWEPLYRLHEELDVAWGFHEGTGVWDSHMNTLYGENRFYRHVASHWIEMQQAAIAQIIGGMFEFHPSLRVAYLEAQNSWVPGLLTRIGWDYPNYRETHAPYLSLTPMEYFERNCWAAVEGSEPEIGPTAVAPGRKRRVESKYLLVLSVFPTTYVPKDPVQIPKSAR